MRDACRELAERGKLFCLHQAALGAAQLIQRPGELVRTRLNLVEQADILDRDYGLVGEALDEFDLTLRERVYRPPCHDEHPDRHPFAE